MNVDTAKIMQELDEYLDKMISGKADWTIDKIFEASDIKRTGESVTLAKKYPDIDAFFRQTTELGFPYASEFSGPSFTYFVLKIGRAGYIQLTEHAKRKEQKMIALFDPDTWDIIEVDIQKKLSSRLREEGMPDGRMKLGENRMGAFIGHELAVLGWALTHVTDKTEIEVITAFWRRIKPHERLFLYEHGISKSKVDFIFYEMKIRNLFKTGTAKIDLNDFI